MAEPVLVISPHLDDAVLSVGGHMTSLISHSHRVVVATVFSEGRSADRSYSARRREDAAALAIVGAEPRWVGLVDAPFRPNGRLFTELLAPGLSHDERGLVDQVSARLADLAGELAPTRVFAPLGVGNHIDHRICFEAARSLSPDLDVLFYEERPYCHVRYSVAVRLWQLGALPRHGSSPADFDFSDLTLALDSMQSSFLAAHHVKTLWRNPKVRERHLAPLLRDLECASLSSPQGDTTYECTQYTEPTAARVRNAVSAYPSQLEALFGTPEDASMAFVEYSQSISPGAAHAERLWRLPRP